jgi:tryprostatin B 6-hydroxylase
MLPHVFDFISINTGPVGLFIAATLGVLCHRLYFIHGEHHQNATIYVLLWPLLSVFGFFFLHAVHYLDPANPSYAQPLSALISLSSLFFGSMFSSIVLYRLVEHPLRDFDGPRLAAVSKFWHLFRLFKKSNHLLLNELHHKYGAVVRTGMLSLNFHSSLIFIS